MIKHGNKVRHNVQFDAEKVEKIEKWCKKNGDLSFAAFIRISADEKLERETQLNSEPRKK